jgi:hypothetical protein
MVNAMSGHVITAAYMRQPIISLYLVFSVGVSTVGDTAGELRLRSMPGSMGVTVAQASLETKPGNDLLEVSQLTQ